jgi:hypothetical protein
MSILLLAERPLRDLRSRALLAGLPAACGATLLVPSAAPRWPEGFAAIPPEADPAAHGIGRVLLAGAFESRAALDAALALAGRAVAAGARLEVTRLTLEGGAVRVAAPPGIGVLDAAAELVLRDHATADALLVWQVAAPFRLDPYPERMIAPDRTLAETLPPGPILGLGLLGGPELAAARAERGAALRAILAPFAGWQVLPLPAEAPDSALDDWQGSLALLPEGATVLLPELAGPEARRRLTPARLRGLVGRCARVVTSHDLVAAFAVAEGVPVLGLGLPGQRRIGPCLATLANALPPGSNLLYPERDSTSALA